MTTVELDSLMLGANPLSGVDHLSSERARGRAGQLTLGLAETVIESAWQAGVRAMTYSSNPLFKRLFAAKRASDWLAGMSVYPLVPSLGDYWPALMSGGVSAMAAGILRDLSWSGKAKAVLRGGATLVTMNPSTAIRAYLDVELERLRRELPRSWSIKSLVLNETFTDFALAFRAVEALETFLEFSRRRKLIPALQTRNFPSLLRFLNEVETPTHDVTIMAPFNPLGFQMTPNLSECELALRSLRGRKVIAISVLAAGQVELSTAVAYIRRLRAISSIAVGVSSPRHVAETFSALQSCFGPAGLANSSP